MRILSLRIALFTLLALGATEGVMRIGLLALHGRLRPVQFLVNDPVYGFRPVPGAVDWQSGYEWNSVGFRGSELNPNDTRPKIVCLGGSTTFGTGNALEDTFPSRLQDELGQRALVINAAVGGWGMAQYAERLEREILALEPRLIVLESTVNSMVYPAPYFKRGELPTYALFNHSFLFKFVDKALSLTELGSIHYPDVRMDAGDDEFNEFDRRLASDGPDRYRIQLERFLKVAKERGIQVALVIPPLRKDSEFLAAPDRSDLMNARIRDRIFPINHELAMKYGVRLVDLRQLFEKTSDPARHFIDAVHPAPAGNRLIARAIYTSIEGDFGLGKP